MSNRNPYAKARQSGQQTTRIHNPSGRIKHNAIYRRDYDNDLADWLEERYGTPSEDEDVETINRGCR